MWSVFEYRPYTHAFFPQDHFDEVIQEGNWTFGRTGDGYVALYSWREPTWREYDPTVYATRDMVKPFDLVADGGPDNVWIVEVGDSGQAPFGEWVDERTAAAVERRARRRRLHRRLDVAGERDAVVRLDRTVPARRGRAGDR